MAASTAICTDLRREILRILQEDITYQVQDDDGGSSPELTSITFQKTRLQKSRRYEEVNQTLDYPAIILCEPLSLFVREEGGTNEEDLWRYRWLVQIVDKDLWEEEGRIATWEKWREQIVSALMFSNLNSVVERPKGEIWWSNASPISDLDESTWIKDAQFISGIEISVKVLQPRGIRT